MVNKLTLIKRSNPICPNCIKMQDALDGEGISYDVVDIAIDTDAIEKYGIMSVPVVLIKDGDETIRLNGLQPIEVVKEFLED